jgi:hypothetical protein
MSKLDNMHSSLELENAYRDIDWTQRSSYHSYSLGYMHNEKHAKWISPHSSRKLKSKLLLLKLAA